MIGIDLAGKTAAAVAERVDRRLVPEPGLMRWNGALTTPVKERLPATTEPWLLFLHGTFSNTQGSFGKLAGQTAQWRRLQAAYPDRILALDHHTLTRSPIDNANEALSVLPRRRRPASGRLQPRRPHRRAALPRRAAGSCRAVRRRRTGPVRGCRA